ncbi:MAG: GntR family transcriptional regulator [Actinomycetota bacterium]
MSTVDVVESAVRSELLRGELPPGTRLRQDPLAERLGVSKIPVREALQRLAALGLLQFEANRGVLVPHLTAEEAEEHYALRAALEPLLLTRAVPRLTVVDLAEAELALTDRARPLAEANWAFHRALYRAAGWDRAVATVELLHVTVAPYVVLYTDGLGGASDSEDEHRRILEACRRGDRDAAVSALEAHLEQAATALVAFLRTEPGAG